MSNETEQLIDGVGDSAEVHNPLAVGVPVGQWFVALVAGGKEHSYCKLLQRSGYEAYVAAQHRISIYANRTRHEYDQVVISRHLFVRTTEDGRQTMMHRYPGFFRFLTNKSAKPAPNGLQPLLVIPDGQVQKLKSVLSQTDLPVSFSDRPLRRGENVRVINGPLIGFECSYLRDDDHGLLVLCLEGLGNALVAVSPSDVIRLPNS